MIKVWDYLKEYEAHREEILAAVDETFKSGRLILGAKVTEFETKWAAYCGLSQPGAGVAVPSSGPSARAPHIATTNCAVRAGSLPHLTQRALRSALAMLTPIR